MRPSTAAGRHVSAAGASERQLALAQNGSRDGEHTAPALVSFVYYCNRSWAQVDWWADALCMTVLTTVMVRWRDQLPPLFFVSFSALLTLCMLRWLAASWWPEVYMRWRELLVAGASVAILAAPSPTLFVRGVAQMLRSSATGSEGGLKGCCLSLMVGPSVLVCASAAHQLAFTSLGYRLRLPAHVLLHATLLVWTLAHASSSCQVIMAELGPGQALPGSKGLFNLFSSFLIWINVPMVVPLPYSPEAQCRCLVPMMQVVAFLLPAAVHIAREARVYDEYRRANPGGRASTELLHRFYLGTARALDLMPPDVMMSMAFLALSAVWFALLLLTAP